MDNAPAQNAACAIAGEGKSTLIARLHPPNPQRDTRQRPLASELGGEGKSTSICLIGKRTVAVPTLLVDRPPHVRLPPWSFPMRMKKSVLGSGGPVARQVGRGGLDK